MTTPVAVTAVPGWVRDRLAGLPGTRWVGVDGFGAAGKTTLATAIAGLLPGAVVVSVDDFGRVGLPGWDRALFTEQVLEPLIAGRVARYQTWDLLVDRPVAWREVPVGVPVIVEGVSCTDDRVPVPWDVRIWVDVSTEVRWSRILARDPPALLERWRTEWLPQEQAYAAEQDPRARADLVAVPVS